jgi:hypothetical protein
MYSCKAYNNQDEKNDRSQFGLKGNIRSLVEKTFDASEQFGQISKSDVNPSETYTVTYNEDGNMIEERGSCYVRKYSYFENGRKKEERSYDIDGLLSSVSKHEYEGDSVDIAKFYDKNSAYTSKRITRYDSRGNLILLQDYDPKGVLTGRSNYQYDKNNNAIGFRNYDSNGKLTYKSDEHVYDNKKNIIESILYNTDGTVSNKRITKYKYDQKGNKLAANTYDDTDNNFICKEIFKYDKKGNLVDYSLYSETTKHDENNGIVSLSLEKYNTITKYEYDNQGNWIKSTTITNGQPEKIIEREFEYYK